MHEHAFSRARAAYERDHILGGVRGVVLAGGLAALAFTLHTRTNGAVAMAAVLVATLGALGWRGGAWRRGAFAGVIAGVPPMIVPIAVAALSHSGHCTACGAGPSWMCTVACFGTSGIVGALVGASATTDRAPRSFAIAATATAAVTGLLGCAAMGFGGALGVVAGLVAGGVTGWFAAPRATAS